MRAIAIKLLGLLLIGAAAGLLYTRHAPADERPAAAPPRVAVAPLELPVAASASTPRPSSRPSSRPAPVAVSAPAAPPIGSEGYGPHIELAQAGQDPQAVWQAVQWLRLCASNATRRDNFEINRNLGILPETMTMLMVDADAEGRRCQTVTAQHLALLPELAARAMRAGVPWAAFAYAEAVAPADLSATQRQEVADAMRHHALTGDALILARAAMTDGAWGLNDTERLQFLMAARLLYDEPGINVLPPPPQPDAIHLATPPTPQQLADARLAARQMLERAGVELQR